MYSIRMIEHAAYMYLRSLSFNQVIAIFGSQYEKNIFTKDRLIRHIEELADRIPASLAITQWLKPERSGYYALDGTWLKYRGRSIVLLIVFDVETLDIVHYRIAHDENQETYGLLIKECMHEISKAKGFFCDGDLGLLYVLKTVFPNVPLQLCVFHKYARVQQIIPFIHIKTALDKEIKKRVEQVLFATSKGDAIAHLKALEVFAKEHSAYTKLRKIIGVLRRNFALLLTHFDHPDMSPYNNVLEGFNDVIKRRTLLMKGFKKPINIERWLKLIMLDWRFHILKETAFKKRRNKSPLQLAGVELPKIYNWLSYIRKNFGTGRW